MEKRTGGRRRRPGVEGISTSTPWPRSATLPSTYTCLHVVGDLIVLLDAVAADQDKVFFKLHFFVGHDWGAVIAWHLCLFRPDRPSQGCGQHGVAFTPRNPQYKPSYSSPKSSLWNNGNYYYVCRFQFEEGEVEAELAQSGGARV
ncbi:hypothetical protein M0R45_011151 [Rubus argutus]|uniref:Uncharacterized protein n=1 Tax=Rubus argutus TaxID=59490 RepID=A0AAW1YCV8_RUBAR